MYTSSVVFYRKRVPQKHRNGIVPAPRERKTQCTFTWTNGRLGVFYARKSSIGRQHGNGYGSSEKSETIVLRTQNVVVLVDVLGDDIADGVSDLEFDPYVLDLEIFAIFLVFQHLQAGLDVGFRVGWNAWHVLYTLSYALTRISFVCARSDRIASCTIAVTNPLVRIANDPVQTRLTYVSDEQPLSLERHDQQPTVHVVRAVDEQIRQDDRALAVQLIQIHPGKRHARYRITVIVITILSLLLRTEFQARVRLR